jgi:hypothetical protein
MYAPSVGSLRDARADYQVGLASGFKARCKAVKLQQAEQVAKAKRAKAVLDSQEGWKREKAEEEAEKRRIQAEAARLATLKAAEAARLAALKAAEEEAAADFAAGVEMPAPLLKTEVNPMDLALVGSRIKKRFAVFGGGKLYPGTITRVYADGGERFATITFDDGDVLEEGACKREWMHILTHG